MSDGTLTLADLERHLWGAATAAARSIPVISSITLDVLLQTSCDVWDEEYDQFEEFMATLKGASL